MSIATAAQRRPRRRTAPTVSEAPPAAHRRVRMASTTFRASCAEMALEPGAGSAVPSPRCEAERHTAQHRFSRRIQKWRSVHVPRIDELTGDS